MLAAIQYVGSIVAPLEFIAKAGTLTALLRLLAAAVTASGEPQQTQEQARAEGRRSFGFKVDLAYHGYWPTTRTPGRTSFAARLTIDSRALTGLDLARKWPFSG